MSEPTILLVDDEPANIQVMFAALKGFGRVLFATSGEKALEIAEDSPPDMVFLDINMPQMDGFEVCRRLKAQPSTQDSIVIFVSGDGEIDQVEAALEAGGSDFMTKPIAPALVQSKAKQALERIAAAAKNKPAPAINTGPQNLLLVEDGEINRMIIGEIMEKAGHSVTMAETGAQALELLAKNSFDCILLDIHLPDMTGLKVIRYIRSLDGEKSQTRTIAVTGDVTTESIEDYLTAGFDSVAPKPIDPHSLLLQITGEDVDLNGILLSAPELGGPDLLINPERMAILTKTYSEERLLSLFNLFTQEIEDYLTTLNKAYDARNDQAIIQTAHRLKSALGHFACAKMQGVAHILCHEKDLPMSERRRLIDIMEEQRKPTLAALAGALDFQIPKNS
ncbi:MAG: hypothetical protein COB46_00850 [Rhodospirillaceae bacterium]|nr:MAG: hypothetical protein COB46_00850 [Rhodospirillaceae bacterium]